MATQTYNKWPDPEIKREGINQNEPGRKGKHIRKYSILYCTGKFVKALIVTAAFLTIMAAAGNAIEMLARM